MQLSDDAVNYFLLANLQTKREDLATFVDRICQATEEIRRKKEFRDLPIWVVIQGCCREKNPADYFRRLLKKAAETARTAAENQNKVMAPHFFL